MSNLDNLNIRVTDTTIWIENSYRYSKKEFDKILDKAQKILPKAQIWLRSRRSLKREWAVHNFLYNLNYQRNRTKDVDLDYPQPCKYRWGYGIFGFFALIFIR